MRQRPVSWSHTHLGEQRVDKSHVEEDGGCHQMEREKEIEAVREDFDQRDSTRGNHTGSMGRGAISGFSKFGSDSLRIGGGEVLSGGLF